MPPYREGRGGPGGWWILVEPELHLGQQIVVPDWAGWRRVRMPALPPTAYFPLPPDWLCEIVSPSTASFDRAKKLRVYAKHGVEHVWLIDPIAQTLEVLHLENGRWIVAAVHAGDETVRAEPFTEIAIELPALWAEPAE